MKAGADELANLLQRRQPICVHFFVKERQDLLRCEHRRHVVERLCVVAKLAEARLAKHGDDRLRRLPVGVEPTRAALMQHLAPSPLDRVAHDEHNPGVGRELVDVREAFASQDRVLGRHLAGEGRLAAMMEEALVPGIVDGGAHVIAIPGPLAAVLGELAPLRPHALVVLAVARAPFFVVQMLGDSSHMVEIVDFLDRRDEQVRMAGEHAGKPSRARFLGADADEVVLNDRR